MTMQDITAPEASTAPGASTTPRVAVLGTGTMGAAMARNLLNAGLPADVWNRTPEPAERLAGMGASVSTAGDWRLPTAAAIARHWHELAGAGLAGLDVSAARRGLG